MATLKDYRDERLKKLSELRALGINPYPAKSYRTHKLKEVSENFETEIDGLYAIGDCAKKDVYQLVTAASDGCIAVSDIEKIRN